LGVALAARLALGRCVQVSYRKIYGVPCTLCNAAVFLRTAHPHHQPTTSVWPLSALITSISPRAKGITPTPARRSRLPLRPSAVPSAAPPNPRRSASTLTPGSLTVQSIRQNPSPQSAGGTPITRRAASPILTAPLNPRAQPCRRPRTRPGCAWPRRAQRRQRHPRPRPPDACPPPAPARSELRSEPRLSENHGRQERLACRPARLDGELRRRELDVAGDHQGPLWLQEAHARQDIDRQRIEVRWSLASGLDSAFVVGAVARLAFCLFEILAKQDANSSSASS
jgi:hypothetical protein